MRSVCVLCMYAYILWGGGQALRGLNSHCPLAISQCRGCMGEAHAPLRHLNRPHVSYCWTHHPEPQVSEKQAGGMLLVVTFGVSGEIQGHTHSSAFIIMFPTFLSKWRPNLNFYLFQGERIQATVDGKSPTTASSTCLARRRHFQWPRCSSSHCFIRSGVPPRSKVTNRWDIFLAVTLVFYESLHLMSHELTSPHHLK